MDFIKTERTTQIGDEFPFYIVHLENIDNEDVELIQTITIRFKRVLANTIQVLLYVNKRSSGCYVFKSREEVNNFWMEGTIEEKIAKLIQKLEHGGNDTEADIILNWKGEKKFPISTLQMLTTIYFPTNWLILLPEKV